MRVGWYCRLETQVICVSSDRYATTRVLLAVSVVCYDAFVGLLAAQICLHA